MIQNTRSCPNCRADVNLESKYCPKCGKALPPPLKVFVSYAHEDDTLREKLDKHLSLLKRQQVIDVWQDRNITGGTEWDAEIEKNLNEANVILLLISPDFMASDFCYGYEMQRAIERHNEKKARVIPIILRPVEWHGAPFGRLQALPTNGKPITQWADRDEALLDVAKGIKRAIK